MIYVALLRGINVGGSSVISMAELRKAFEELGFRDVKTVLASGNVLFETSASDPAELVRNIERGLAGVLGRDVPTIVRTLEDLRTLRESNPFAGIEASSGRRRFVTFLADTPARPPELATSREGFAILAYRDGMICSVLDEKPGVGAVKLMSGLEKEFGSRLTTRSWETIEKILKAGAASN